LKNAVYLWHQPLEAILKERENTLKILNNHTKDLDFFSENRLIYAFQRNIVSNNRTSAYSKWFNLAHKSRNANNTEDDFSQFNNDDVMAEVIKRLEKDKLTTEEYRFVSDLPLFEAYYGNMQQDLAVAEKKVQLAEKKVEEEHQKFLETIEHLLRNGYTVESIANLLARNIEEIAGFVAEIKAKKS
jgi:hypothetical protein